MKTNYIKLLSLLLGAGGLIASCSDSVDVGSVSEKSFETPAKTMVFLTDKYGNMKADSVVFNNAATIDMYVNVNQTLDKQEQFSVTYDPSVLEAYNKEHNTSYQALPENLVTVGEATQVEKGNSKSAPISVAYKTDAALEENGTYAIPLSLKGKGVETSKDGNFVLLVKDISKMPDCHKNSPFINISMPEVNNSNPLNALCFTLKNSKKYFFDQVVLFAGNINYNEETGEVYNKNNENVTQLLNYKEKYLAPLRAKGIKVIMGILGNWDRAALTNLTEEGAKAFARHMKAMCDAYDLDGVFLDDEYSKPGNYPGFESPYSNQASRLCYYLKEYLGKDRLVEVYVYGGTAQLSAYKGKQPGEFIDFAIQDYGQIYDLSGNYPGLKRTGMIQASSECTQSRYIYQSNINKIVSEKYGGTMWFAFDPSISRYNLTVMQNVSRTFYDEDLIYNEKPFKKDW